MTTVDINKTIIPNSFEFNFFDQLKRNSYYEPNKYDKGRLQYPNKPPQPNIQKTLNDASVLYHSGDQILQKIPFENINSRLLFDYNNGRNLNLLSNIKTNSTKNYPDVNFKGQNNIGYIS